VLTINALAYDTITETLCQGDIVTIRGQVFTQNGSFTDTLPSHTGCDSLSFTTLLVFNQRTYDTISHTMCQGDTFFVNYHPFTRNGIFNDTMPNAGGCDSVVTLKLTVNEAPVVTLNWDSMEALARFTELNGDPFPSYCYFQNPDTVQLVGGNPPGGGYSGKDVFNNGNVYYTYLSNGPFYQGFDTISYTVDSNGCIASASNVVAVQLCEGIPVISGANLFKLYPNPANDYTTISFDAAYTGATIFVKDITGRQLDQKQLTHSPQQIPTGNLPPGVYLVTMYINGEVGARLLVKE
jgi:hypothetical protein